ncbi:hypothetical protein PHJA_001813500 [Phtheirospermum japonicum]|uniref:Uncharacterized protein n=1 Tax=Phtheirospermum japonicum TaxID=374723 RepID=A0A830CK89_9LAMI|nr:hypothetical protein PHJA_001813500 [Phtheirospermum japonicum]
MDSLPHGYLVGYITSSRFQKSIILNLNLCTTESKFIHLVKFNRERPDKFRSHGHIRIIDLKMSATASRKTSDYPGRTKSCQEAAMGTSNGSHEKTTCITLEDDVSPNLVYSA